MKRTDYYTKLTVDGVYELDFLWNSVGNFTTSYPVKYYRVKDEDQMRLDLVSYKMYGSTDFWWIIGVINNVENPLIDIVPGMLLKIPSVLDVYDFSKRFRCRRS
jgi:hypothetical protein